MPPPRLRCRAGNCLTAEPSTLPPSPHTSALHASGARAGTLQKPGRLCQTMLFVATGHQQWLCRGGGGQGPQPLAPVQQHSAGLGLQSLSIHSKAAESKPAAPSRLLSKDPAAIPVSTDPSSQPPTAQHSTAQHNADPGCSAAATARGATSQDPTSLGTTMGPGVSHSPRSSRVPVPRAAPPQCPQQLSPGLSSAVLGDLSMCQLCRVPCPDHEAGRVLTRPSLLLFPQVPERSQPQPVIISSVCGRSPLCPGRGGQGGTLDQHNVASDCSARGAAPSLGSARCCTNSCGSRA